MEHTLFPNTAEDMSFPSLPFSFPCFSIVSKREALRSAAGCYSSLRSGRLGNDEREGKRERKRKKSLLPKEAKKGCKESDRHRSTSGSGGHESGWNARSHNPRDVTS